MCLLTSVYEPRDIMTAVILCKPEDLCVMPDGE